MALSSFDGILSGFVSNRVRVFLKIFRKTHAKMRLTFGPSRFTYKVVRLSRFLKDQFAERG